MQRKEQIIYIDKEGNAVEPMNKFVYEMSICKYTKATKKCKGMYEMIYNKMVASDKPLKLPKHLYEKRSKKDTRGYFYAKFVDWLGAPLSYLLENNFKLATNVTNDRKRSKRSSNCSSGNSNRKITRTTLRKRK